MRWMIWTMVLVVAGCDVDKPPKNATDFSDSEQSSSETPHQTAARFSEESQVLLDTRTRRTWYPACTADVPRGAQCGMIVQKDWANHLRSRCGDAADPGVCANRWVDGVMSLLEARYGGSASQTADLCGDQCNSPLMLELKMLEGYNNRVRQEYRDALDKLESRMYRQMADNQAAREEEARKKAEADEYNRRFAAGMQGMIQGLQGSGQPPSCTDSSQCGLGNICVRAANSNNGFCAAR